MGPSPQSLSSLSLKLDIVLVAPHIGVGRGASIYSWLCHTNLGATNLGANVRKWPMPWKWSNSLWWYHGGWVSWGPSYRYQIVAKNEFFRCVASHVSTQSVCQPPGNIVVSHLGVTNLGFTNLGVTNLGVINL